MLKFTHTNQTKGIIQETLNKKAFSEKGAFYDYFIDIGNTRIKYTDAKAPFTQNYCDHRNLEPLLNFIQQHNPRLLFTAGRSVIAQESLATLQSSANKLHIQHEVVSVRPAILPTNYNDTTQFGADRFLQLLAGCNRCSTPFCVVSAGTAITLDFYTHKHIGGMILLGLGSARTALIDKTGLTRIEKPTLLLGNDTATSIGAGLYIGYQNLITASISRVSKREKVNFYTYWTGGDAPSLFTDELLGEQIPTLLFEGMAVYRNHLDEE